MSSAEWLIAYLIARYVAEIIFAERNTARLVAAGAVEFGRSHFPPIVALHVTWLAALLVFGRHQEVNNSLLAIFIFVQGARIWTIASLGRRWTARVVVIPGVRLVSGGAYRFMRHPNYLIVLVEIALVPLALGMPWVALLFSVLNVAILLKRIRIEDVALAWAVRAPLARRPKANFTPR